MNMFDKALVHLRDIYRAKDAKFTYYRLLHIIDRRVNLPPWVFSDDVSNLGVEQITPLLYPNKKHQCFIDVGANRGEYTYQVAAQGYRVYAYEPSPRALETLRKQVKDYGNVTIYPVALGARNTCLRINLHYNCGHNSLVNMSRDFTGKTSMVQVKTLDSYNLENVGVIKIDTEGYEYNVLKGAEKTIKRDMPRLLIEVHAPYEIEELKIVNLLNRYGYTNIERVYKKYRNKHREKPQYHLHAYRLDDMTPLKERLRSSGYIEYYEDVKNVC